jgi:hypothetical protein
VNLLNKPEAKDAAGKFILEPKVEPSNNINFSKASFALLEQYTSGIP